MTYRPGLDGVRAIAILLVVAAHSTGWPHGGAWGVDLFFVLSGFLITTLLLERRGEGLVAFYKRRARRLMPAVFFMLLVYLAVVSALNPTHLRLALEGVTVTALYSMNMVVSWPEMATKPFELTHMWSLAAEEQFYLAWPVILLIVCRANRRVAVTLLALVIAALSARAIFDGAHRVLEFSPVYRSTVALAVGCLFAMVPTGWCRHLAPVGLALVAVPVFFPALNTYGRGHLLFCVAAAVLVTGVLEPSRLQRALSVRPLVHVGKVSYSLYLWHVPVLVALGQFLPAHIGWRTLGAVAASFAAAEFSYRYVETPFRLPRRVLQPVRGTT